VGDMMKLNSEQEKVIQSNERFLFLLAGAGSGKTRVIVEKIKRILNEGVEPESILAITFTRKSAFEMKERINHPSVHVHTFHQFCYLRLLENQSKPFTIIKETKTSYKKDELLKISKYKNSLYRTIKPKSYDKYQSELKTNNEKDFDDLLLDYLNILKKERPMKPYEYLFIDEFQDTNLLQYEIVKKLINHQTKVLAVGDPDQSIYQFRGANSKIIDFFITEFKASLHTLSINYRSNETIIKHANQLIGLNNRKYKKELISHSKEKEVVFSLYFKDEIEEANYLIELIASYLNKGHKPNNICVLYRNHFRSYEFKYQLAKSDISFQTNESKEGEQGINLLSIHQAKGLEFDIVFIIGLEKGVLPSLKNNTQIEHDEERRLMFVAITRARHHLIFSHVRINSLNVIQKPSKFIIESGVKHIKKNHLMV